MVATDAAMGIGKDGTMPWHLPADLAYFKRITSTAPPGKMNVVIMGRKTWESIPDRFRPLPGRINIVVSRQTDYELPNGVLLAGSLDLALDLANKDDVENAFVIGGGQLYKEALSHCDCTGVYITKIAKTFACDTVFPSLPDGKFEGVYASNYMVNDDFSYCFKQFKLS